MYLHVGRKNYCMSLQKLSLPSRTQPQPVQTGPGLLLLVGCFHSGLIRTVPLSARVGLVFLFAIFEMRACPVCLWIHVQYWPGPGHCADLIAAQYYRFSNILIIIERSSLEYRGNTSPFISSLYDTSLYVISQHFYIPVCFIPEV